MDALGAINVLERDWDAGERPGISGGAAIIGGTGPSEGDIARFLRPDEGIQLAIELRDAVEEQAGQLD
jgi:hypothetical protein